MIRPRWLPSALTHSRALDEANAMTCPWADQVGLAEPLVVASHAMPDPSAFMTDTRLELQENPDQGQVTNARRLPSGDHAGW